MRKNETTEKQNRANAAKSKLAERNVQAKNNVHMLEGLEDRTTPAAGFALTTAAGVNSLLRFDTAAPNSITSTTPVTGLQGGESLLGIDFRPATGQLFGLGSTSRLYTIDVTTGAATQVGPVFPTALNGASFGFDFNPTVDRIRIVSDAGQNLRINPNDGSETVDPNLNGAATAAVGAAYTNNFANATTTQLFVINPTTDHLYQQNPANAGTLVDIGSLGVDVDTSANVAFDIQGGGAGSLAFAALRVNGSSNLYVVNLQTGTTTNLGAIGTGVTAVNGLAVAPQVVGTDGNDTIFVTPDGASTTNVLVSVNGGPTQSLFNVPGIPLQIFGDAGNDTIDASTLTVGVGINGNDGNDTIFTGSGNDTIQGNGGDDAISSGGGNDIVLAGDGNDFVFAGDGSDSVDGGAGNDGVDGGAGDDAIFLGSGADFGFAGDGNDSVDGGSGNDGIDGNGGNDALFGGADEDVVFGSAGADSLDGGDNNDKMDGGADDDLMFGGGEDDLMFGSDGNDSLDGQAGNDSMDGADGNDLMFGSSGDDFIFGGDGTDSIDGGSGDDSVDGMGGNDTLAGNDGNDRIFGSAGDDQIFGGDGLDSLDAGAGNDFADGQGGNDLVFGQSGADSLGGGDGNDSLDASVGDDFADGGFGNDIIFGGDGSDTLRAGSGLDTLFGGGGGADVLQ